MATRILITGGAGFIASALAERLAESPEYKITIVDNLVTGQVSKLPVMRPAPVQFIKCDVNEWEDISSVFHAGRFDYVFHFAALVGVHRTLENPVKVLDDINGIRNILSLSKNSGVKRVFYSSSSEVYGEPVEFPQNEHTTPLNSRLPYAIVKNVGEAFLKSYKKEYDLDYTIFRFFNTFGPKQSKDFVISRFLARALNGEDIPINGDGSQTRTFCYIDDNVNTCAKIFEENLFVNDIINIGGDREVTILELAETIIRISKSGSKVVFKPALEEGDMKRRLPDNSKMKQVLNKELISLEEGIQRILGDLRFIL